MRRQEAHKLCVDGSMMRDDQRMALPFKLDIFRLAHQLCCRSPADPGRHAEIVLAVQDEGRHVVCGEIPAKIGAEPGLRGLQGRLP